MPLVPTKKMLAEARDGGYAVGAFEFWSLDSAQAIVRAAEKYDVPVILQAGALETDYAGGYENIAAIARVAAEKAAVPVALHLDHGETLEQARQAIECGFTSVMIDASHLKYSENVAVTRRVIELARPHGVSVEAELGVLAGAEGNINVEDANELQTSPEQAAQFVRDTDVDLLAVSIGTAHGFYKFTPEINISRLKKIAAVVDRPLVLHGGSGTPEDKVREAILCGISKINICTEFIAAYGKAYSDVQSAEGFKYNVTSLFEAGRQKGHDLVCSKIAMFKYPSQ